MDDCDYYEKRKSFTALSSSFDLNQLDQPYTMDPMTSSPMKPHPHLLKRQDEFRSSGDYNGENESYEQSPSHVVNETEEFTIAIEQEEAELEGEGYEENEDQGDDDFYCTIIFNGNAVLNGNATQQRSPKTMTPMTTIVSQRGRDKSVDMVKYLPGGFVSVESGNAAALTAPCCCCGCRSRHLVNESSLTHRCSRRLKRRPPILTSRNNSTNIYSTPSSNGSLKKVKCLSRSIYLPSPNATRRLTTSTMRSLRPKSINLDDFERNSIVTISYYGDEANTSNSECDEEVEAEIRRQQTTAANANSYGDLNASVSTNSTQVNDSISNINNAADNTNTNTNNNTNTGLINESNIGKSVSNAVISAVKSADRKLNELGKEYKSQVNDSHVSGEFVLSSSAEDLREPKEGTTDLNEQEKGSIERSYVPYKPKSEEKSPKGEAKQVNDFATEIIMKPKPKPSEIELGKQLLQDASEKLPNVSDMIKKAAGMVINDDYDKVANELEKLTDDVERLKRVDELAKARAAIPKKIDLLSVKMF